MTATEGRWDTVITAWSAVSPFGIGRAAFARGVTAGVTTAAALPGDQWPQPDPRACVVPDFTVRQALGSQGTRSMDRATGLAVAAVGRLLDEEVPGSSTATGDAAGLVLGTTTGSAQSMADFTRDSLVQARPFFVDPAQFPNTVMNCAAGQCAIWYRLKGPNVTVAGGRVAGLHALRYAQRLLGSGRAGSVLCGAVEELSPLRCRLEWYGREAGERDFLLGEGCAMVLLEPAGRPARPLATVLAVELAGYGGDDLQPVLAACMRQALRRSGAGVADLWAVSTSGAPGAVGAQERAAVAGLVDGREVARIRPAALIGDTGAAGAAFQLAAVLAEAAQRPHRRERIALVTAADRDGVAGCALLHG